MKSTLNFMDGEPNEAGGVWRVKLQIPLSGAKIPPVGALVTVFGRRGWTWQATNSSQVLAVSCRLLLSYMGGGAICAATAAPAATTSPPIPAVASATPTAQAVVRIYKLPTCL